MKPCSVLFIKSTGFYSVRGSKRRRLRIVRFFLELIMLNCSPPPVCYK